MTIGRLTQATITNTTNTVIYTVPAGKIACVDLSIVQSGTSVTTDVSIAVGINNYVQDLYKIAPIGPTGAARSNLTPGIIMRAGEKISVLAGASANLYYTVRGIEEDELI